MTSRERVIRSLLWQPADRVPRQIVYAPAGEGEMPPDVAEICCRYPMDIERAEFQLPRGERVSGKRGQVGQYVDDWGCTWEIRDSSLRCRLIHSPLADIGKLSRYQPPLEILKRWNLGPVSQQCAESSRFIVAFCEGRLFERICWLRSRSAAVGDLRKDSKPIRKLLAMVQEFCLREVELWCSSDVDGVILSDGWWAEQPSIDVGLWRQVFKPIYRQMCEMIRRADKFVFFDVHGPCAEVLPDLVEIGVDALGVDWQCLPFEEILPQYRGKVAFWVGPVDPSAVAQLTPDQAREGVRRLRRILQGNNVGLIARFRWTPSTNFKTMVTFYEYWLEPASALLAAATSGTQPQQEKAGQPAGASAPQASQSKTTSSSK
ncbi:MAG: hypothetical protein NZ899_00265 [Thermoguttaceae bacterium]|nr:hypothetical protein [Thermoguttaceae bacterium]MDW8077330.1 uroporphyrinogen decarboxylase family protein [Thermoguttaceae bacterium]